MIDHLAPHNGTFAVFTPRLAMTEHASLSLVVQRSTAADSRKTETTHLMLSTQ